MESIVIPVPEPEAVELLEALVSTGAEPLEDSTLVAIFAWAPALVFGVGVVLLQSLQGGVSMLPAMISYVYQKKIAANHRCVHCGDTARFMKKKSCCF